MYIQKTILAEKLYGCHRFIYSYEYVWKSVEKKFQNVHIDSENVILFYMDKIIRKSKIPVYSLVNEASFLYWEVWLSLKTAYQQERSPCNIELFLLYSIMNDSQRHSSSIVFKIMKSYIFMRTYLFLFIFVFRVSFWKKNILRLYLKRMAW